MTADILTGIVAAAQTEIKASYPADAILTQAQACAYLGDLTIAQLIRMSSGPRPLLAVIKRGNSRTYRFASLLAYTIEHETPAAPPLPWGMTAASDQRINGTRGRGRGR